MLTAVWFILVAIAIPCQAYLDDRVLLDQHWTGFSPTTGVGVREDACEARNCGSARRHDHDPDKRSVGFSVLSENKPQMVRGARSATRRSQESYLRFRRESARDSGVAERSVRRVLVSLERLSRRERTEASTRSVESAILLESRVSDLRGEARESRDERTRLDVTNEERPDRYARQRMAEDTPTWVREDSRRRIRSANRNRVRSDDRRTSDRVRRYESEARTSRGRRAADLDARRRHDDVQALSLTRLSRLTETRTQNLEGEKDLIRATRSDTSRSGPSRLRANSSANRDRHLQDAMDQGDRIIGRRSNLIGLAQGPSFRMRGPELRKVQNSEHRHAGERNSDATALIQSTPRRGATLARQPCQENLRRSRSISSGNSKEGDDGGNQERRTVHAERSISDLPVSLKDENRDTRRFSASRQYINGGTRGEDLGATRSFFGSSNRHARNRDSYSSSLRRLQDPEPKETAQDRHDHRRFSSRSAEVQPGDIPNRRSYAGSSRVGEMRFPDAMRSMHTRTSRIFDWANKAGNSDQVRTRSQVRSDDTRRNSMALSRRSRDRHTFTRTVEYPADIVRYGDSRLERGSRLTRQDRLSEDYGQALILFARHSANRLQDSGDRYNPLPHIEDSRRIMGADLRHREGRLSSVERQGMPTSYGDFRFEETRRSVRLQTRRSAIIDDIMTAASRSMGNIRNGAARNSLRLTEDDTQILLSRLERYPTRFLEKRQDSSENALNNRRDLPNMPFLKTELSSSLREGLEKILPEEGSDKYKEKISRYAKHHQEDLSWDKVMSSNAVIMLSFIAVMATRKGWSSLSFSFTAHATDGAIILRSCRETPPHSEKTREAKAQTGGLTRACTRSGSSLLQTILTVGMVAWMTTSPSKKLVD